MLEASCQNIEMLDSFTSCDILAMACIVFPSYRSGWRRFSHRNNSNLCALIGYNWRKRHIGINVKRIGMTNKPLSKCTVKISLEISDTRKVSARPMLSYWNFFSAYPYCTITNIFPLGTFRLFIVVVFRFETCFFIFGILHWARRDYLFINSYSKGNSRQTA